jgi:hypothetical protein
MQVGLTFNLKHGKTESIPDPSASGDSNYQTEYDGVKKIETDGSVFELPNGHVPTLYSPGRMPSARRK